MPTSFARQRTIQLPASPYPFHRSPVSRLTIELSHSMSTFDPTTVRKAVEEFTPRRPQKFHDLLPAKDVIAELRQRRASYRSIADMLTQHCLPISKTAVAVFCHQVLGESVRPRKRPGRKRPPVSTPANNAETVSKSTPVSEASASTESSANSNGNEAPPARTRGPRIAQIRPLKPQST